MKRSFFYCCIIFTLFLGYKSADAQQDLTVEDLTVEGTVSIGNSGDDSALFMNAANNKSGVIRLQDDGDAGFQFYIGGFPTMTVGAHNVGIGLNSVTAAPDSRLSILNIGNTTGVKILGFGEGANSDFWFESGYAPMGDENFISFKTTSGADAMSWKRNGNVGIGTTNPTKELVVIGTTSANTIQSRGATVIDGQGAYLGWNRDGSKGRTLLANQKGLGVGGFEFVSYDNENKITGKPLLIDGDGKVGIGTEDLAAGHLLSVGGKIACEQVRVQLASAWPDYVFQETYQLLTLEEVEQYIQQEYHLPGIPSAEEVEAKGIVVGEMQTKLLEKIEELMLYTIEQNKQIQQLLSITTQQQQQIESLKKQSKHK